MTWTLAADAVVPGCARTTHVAPDRPACSSVRSASHQRASGAGPAAEPSVPVSSASVAVASSRADPPPGRARPPGPPLVAGPLDPPRLPDPASAWPHEVPGVPWAVVTLAEWSFDPGGDV
jgi:hypothetical protein